MLTTLDLEYESLNKEYEDMVVKIDAYENLKLHSGHFEKIENINEESRDEPKIMQKSDQILLWDRLNGQGIWTSEATSRETGTNS